MMADAARHERLYVLLKTVRDALRAEPTVGQAEALRDHLIEYMNERLADEGEKRRFWMGRC